MRTFLAAKSLVIKKLIWFRFIIIIIVISQRLLVIKEFIGFRISIHANINRIIYLLSRACVAYARDTVVDVLVS